MDGPTACCHRCKTIQKTIDMPTTINEIQPSLFQENSSAPHIWRRVLRSKHIAPKYLDYTHAAPNLDDLRLDFRLLDFAFFMTLTFFLHSRCRSASDSGDKHAR